MGNEESRLKNNLKSQVIPIHLHDDMTGNISKVFIPNLEDCLVKQDCAKVLDTLQSKLPLSDLLTLVNSRTSLTTLCEEYKACTPLGFAINRGNLELITRLIHNGADLTNKPCYLKRPGTVDTPDIVSPLHLALVMKASVPIVKLLLDRGAELGELSKDNAFPVLKYAVFCEDHDLAKQLVTLCQENVNAKDRDGKTALHHALILGKIKIAAILLEHGADKDVPDVLGRTPLMYALKQNRVQGATKLIGLGANCDALDKRNRNIFHYAIPCAFDLTKEVEGIPLNEENKKKKAAMLELFWPKMTIEVSMNAAQFTKIIAFALENVRQKLVLDLMERYNSFLHSTTLNVGSLLHKAAKHDKPDVVKYLVSKQSFKADLLNKVGWTPLMYAALSGSRVSMMTLIKHGADPNFQAKDGWTPLWCLLTGGHEDMAVYFIRQGCQLCHKLPVRMLQLVKTAVAFPPSLLSELWVSPAQYALHTKQAKVNRILTQEQSDKYESMTLKHQCRLVIRQAMGFGIMDNAHKLDLDSELRLYLTLG